MNLLEEFSQNVTSWPGVSNHPHRFGGREFRFGNGEIGHIHMGGIVDIPFPRSIRDALLEEELVEEHHWVPASGWITYRICDETHLPHALWLMRLSYVRYLLKSAAAPDDLLEEESKTNQLSPRFRSLLEVLIRKPEQGAASHGLSA